MATSEGVRQYRKGKQVAEKSLSDALCDPSLRFLVLYLLDDFDTAPSAEIEAKVKELAFTYSSPDSTAAHTPLMVLRAWDNRTSQRFRYEGYPARGKPSDGLAVWLVECPHPISDRALHCTVRIDNLGKRELDLHPETISWVLLESRIGAPAREISDARLGPTYKKKTWHVLPAEGSKSFAATLSARSLPYVGKKSTRFQIALRGRADEKGDPKAWSGEVLSPAFDVVLPPPKDDTDLEHYREFLRTSRERGSFPEAGVISWEASGRWGLRIEGNRITGSGIWLAMPDDLRRLSAEEVRTICDFLLHNDTFAKGPVEGKAGSMGKYPPQEYFSIVTTERWGCWRGNWLNPSLSRQWKAIRDDLLNGRLQKARDRIDDANKVLQPPQAGGATERRRRAAVVQEPASCGIPKLGVSLHEPVHEPDEPWDPRPLRGWANQVLCGGNKGLRRCREGCQLGDEVLGARFKRAPLAPTIVC